MPCDSGNKGIPKTQTPITVIFRITVVVLVIKAAHRSCLLIKRTVSFLERWRRAWARKRLFSETASALPIKAESSCSLVLPFHQEECSLVQISFLAPCVVSPVSRIHFLIRRPLCYKTESKRGFCAQHGQEEGKSLADSHEIIF